MSEYWVNEARWNWEELGNALPSWVLLKLASRIISSSKLDEDLKGWCGTTNGIFSVKSAYRIETKWTEAREWSGWKLTWGLQVQESVKVFMWTLAHNRLFTNQARWRMNLAINSNCGGCYGYMKDSLLAIRDCNKAHELWLHLVHPFIYQKSLQCN